MAKRNDELCRTLSARLNQLEAIEKSDAWRVVLLPELQRRKAIHDEALRDRNSTPEKRSEHVEASHLVDELIKFPETQRRAVESKLTDERRKSP
jgi:hypothetical protein